jgi:hypothetical protein
VSFLKVEARIDSNEVVNDINHKRSSTIRGKPLVDRICRILEEDWKVVVNHSYREANQLADALARHSYSLSDTCCFFFVDCPNDFKYIIAADEKGFVTPRIISL